MRYTDPDGREVFDSRWWKRNYDEILGIGFDVLEIATGIASLEVAGPFSVCMIVQGGANAVWKTAKIVTTTIIAEIEGDEKADYIDHLLPESIIGAVLYGIAYIVTKIDGQENQAEACRKWFGRLGDLLDLAIGIGLSKSVEKSLKEIFLKDPSMLTKLQKALKLNKENIITMIGEEAYQFFSDLVLTKDAGKSFVEYYGY